MLVIEACLDMLKIETKYSLLLWISKEADQNMAFSVAVALCLFSLFCVEAEKLRVPDPPVWPTAYTAKGIINLPYAEIGEPFHAWYDGPNQRSRIDYYSGMY